MKLMKITYSPSHRNVGSKAGVLAVLISFAGLGTAHAEPADYRPISEVGNNVAHADWGTAGSRLLRGSTGAHFVDGAGEMITSTRPSPRLVSDAVCNQTTSVPNHADLSDYVWAWGQFLDHDLTLVPGTGDSVPVAVPLGDPAFDPGFTGTQRIPFHRAIFDATTGTSSLNPRQQANQITAYIDGSSVYGSDPQRAAWLRTFSGGRLKTTSSPVGDLLPFNDGTQANAGSPEVPDSSTSLFVAGDIRSNEQPVLTLLHTLFVREHNWHAARIAAGQPSLSDEDVYQRARRRVIAELEHITYDEFLPTILGRNALGPYGGYDPKVNPGIANLFAAAAFRLGHTLLSPNLQRLREDGSSIPEGPLPLRDAFFASAPKIVQSEGLEPLLRGLARQRAQDLDLLVIDDVRNFLFGPPGAGGLDLISLNIQRGRDHGLPDFNSIRQEYGLPRVRSFHEITSDRQLAGTLAALYGNVDNIDAFVGLLGESDRDDALVGPTLRAVLVNQFERTRAGDRYWYEATLGAEEIEEVRHTRLSDIIRRNTSIRNIQVYVFRVRDED